MFSSIKFSVAVLMAVIVSTPLFALSSEDYVTIKDGHLWKDGQRQRYWAANILFVGDKYHAEQYSTNYESIDAGVERFEKSGYNAVRYWFRGWGKNVSNYENYEKGDKSEIDYSDYFIYRLKEKGFVIWSAGFNDHVLSRTVTAEDAAIVDDPATMDEWIKCVSAEKVAVNKNMMLAWDTRLEKLYVEHIRKFLTHYNKYTQMYAYEDPVFGAWELTNEEWWISSMLAGNWKACPEYFREQLLKQWNSWLKNKYGTTDKLKASWTYLLEDESLENENILFAPMAINSVDVQIATLGAGNLQQLTKVQLSKDNLPKMRGSDVIEFVTEMFVSYKKRVEAQLRAIGKDGLGCQIVPVIWDTGMRNDLPTAYAFAQSDTTCSGCYIKAMSAEKQNPTFPWLSGLRESPRFYWDSPWLEHNRVEGKPFFVYEAGHFNPSKYRAEWPYRLAALASIQDWDWVSIYQCDGFRRIDAYEKPYQRLMQYENDVHSWSGTYYIFDEVFQAALKSAGEMFRYGTLKPAPKPTVITFGKGAVYNLESQNYRWRPDGLNLWLTEILGPTTYRYGLRLNFDMNQELPVTIAGPYVLNRAFQCYIIKPTDEISYDWHSGYMQFDSALAKSVVGFLPQQWEFSTDVKFSNIQINNPEGQSYVIPGERYAALSLVAQDGMPIAKSSSLSLTAVSTSFNEGFKVNDELMPQMSQKTSFDGLHWGEKLSKLFVQTGKNVLVSRVGAVVDCEALNGKYYREYDFDLNIIGHGKCQTGQYILSSEKPIFFVEFSNETLDVVEKQL